MRYRTILADPPWRFDNATGKIAPEHKRLKRYETMTHDDICGLNIAERFAQETAHLYLWVPNAILGQGLEVMSAWGFAYKTQIIWYKVRKDGGPDRRCCGFYFRNVTESCLFGVRGKNARTEGPYNVPNLIASQKREHSRKPDEIYDLVERCSKGPYLELFARSERPGWEQWGDEMEEPVKL